MHQAGAIEAHSEQLEAYRRLLARDPGTLRFAEYADNLRRSGQLLEAMAVCLAGLARHPGYSTAHVVLGEILSDSGKYVEAEAAWQEALRLDPGHPRAHLRLGELHFRQGRPDLAIGAFEAALLYSPGFPEARAKLALAKGPEKPSSSRLKPAEADSEATNWRGKGPADALVRGVAACAAVEAVALADAAGTTLAGEPRGSRAEGAAPAAAELLRDARDLLARLGAGRLRSALICSDAMTLRCVALDDLALVCALRPQALIGPAAAEIEGAIAAAEGDAQVRQLR